jgi:N6-adenosine-specific RNA methylase IME4
VRIETIKIGKRFRKDLGDVQALARSIATVGLLHPLVIAPDGYLIAGRRRLEAVKRLGWHEVPARVIDIVDIVRGEHDENVMRQDFLPSEVVAIARALEPSVRQAAKERQRATQLAGTTRDGKPIIGEGKLPPPNGRGKTRDVIAAHVGISGRTLEKAATVIAAAEREPDKFAPLVAEMDRTRRVNGVYRKLVTLQQAEIITREPPPLPVGPFRVIAADPPWEYEKRLADSTHRGTLPYPSMTLDEIKALPIHRLAADDAVLWLWTTNAHMRVAFDVVAAWGFAHKTILTWVKQRMGVGDWLRGQTEHCILAVRGRPVITLMNQTTVLYGAAREHSRKPDEFYTMVESLCPGAKVELFARTTRKGWAAHGSETQRFSCVDSK